MRSMGAIILVVHCTYLFGKDGRNSVCYSLQMSY
jgi:hypothetical protein